ncbi:MAG: hypothetical protein ACLGIC_02205 [Acidimicrobiia bacterium]
MIRDRAGLLHPRLTVVPVDDGPRPAIDPAPGRTVVGPAQLERAMEAVAERRRTALRHRIVELEVDLAEAEGLAEAAAQAAAGRRADRDAFLDAATWVEALPEAVAATRCAAAGAEADLADRLRTSRDAARALDRVLEQRAQADAAVAEARRQLDALRSTSGDSPERQQAAAQLESQAASVEARLSEAETEARTRVDDTKRAVTELERELEELGRRLRADLQRLASLVDCLPGESRPPHDDDPLHHVGQVADGLRGLAEVVDAELAGLQAEADRRGADRDGRRRQVEAARWSLERIVPEDAAEALSELVCGVAEGVVVLDGVVAAQRDGDDGLLRALESTEASAPVVVLSADPAVLGWAIDLPADRGVLVGPAAVELLTDPPLARQHAVTSSTGDQP